MDALRGIGYAVNSLNQYTTITNLGYANILGAALATNGVWVNHGLAERKGEYFRKELSVANANGPLWTNVAVGSAGVTNGGGIIVPDDRQTLVYDLDGNLTFDGTWSYEWDGENRLKVMTMTNFATIPNAQRKRLEFGYDHMNRRISKVVKTWNGSSFTSPVTNLFVYDGWNLLAELNTLHSSLCTYLWGQDLSGTMDGAGGVGGLLMVVRHASPSTNCFVAFDGNGNVTALLNAVSGAVEARYEYNPYGEILRTTGPLASANPFRWSTKFWDEESGLVYYGYRYYSPGLGRWIGRDPAEEEGGVNLLAFLGNEPVSSIDVAGEMEWRIDPDNVGINIHDTVGGQDITYGLDADGNAFGFEGFDRGGKHKGQAPQKLVMRSVRENLTNPKRLATLIAKVDHGLQGGMWRGRQLLQRIGRIRASAMNTLRSLGTGTGGAALGGLAIMSAMSASAAMPAKAEVYGREMRSGERAYADLSAIDIALGIQEMGGNYFVTMFALSILLDE